VVAVLEREKTPMTIDQLTDYVVEWEAERSTAQSPDRRQVRTELHDVDLPALDDRGVIEFNSREGLVGHHDAESDSPVSTEASTPTDSEQPGDRRRWRPLLATLGVTLSATVLAALVLGETVAAVLVGVLVGVASVGAAVYRLARRPDAGGS